MSDFSDMLEEMKRDKEGGGVKKFWNIPADKEGVFSIRILPPLKEKGEKKFYFRHRVHWIGNKPYECLNQTITDKNGEVHESRTCPVCNLAKKLYDTSEKGSDEWELASKLRAQDRYIYRVIVRGKKDETAPEFFESGKTIFEILYHIIAETDFGNITDIKNGRDFSLSKKGVGRRAKYETSTASASVSPVFSKTEDLKSMAEHLKKMDYSSLIDVADDKALRNALKEFLDPDNDSGEEGQENNEKEEVKAPQKQQPKSSKQVATDEDEDSSGEEDIDDILNSL